ncbi:MAG: methyltransferase domain-containing protein [Proteobacteria bacterium]|nr:methyltransferase domain-containing protein [Pseudomonadota bacterium]
MLQNKQQEIDFFDNLPSDEYNVFTDDANQKIIDTVLRCLALTSGGQIVDLGCGSGIFTQFLQKKGYACIGVDLSHKLLRIGKNQMNTVQFIQADVEALPFADNSVDAIMLSCLLHHLPNPFFCAKEVFRVLKPQGKFVAFDPNRLNPFMYLYRDRSSPFYSSKGVTPNERPVLPNELRNIFASVGFQVKSQFVDGLTYRYVASDTAKGLLPIYNLFERFFFKPFFLNQFRSFVFTIGQKPK